MKKPMRIIPHKEVSSRKIPFQGLLADSTDLELKQNESHKFSILAISFSALTALSLSACNSQSPTSSAALASAQFNSIRQNNLRANIPGANGACAKPAIFNAAPSAQLADANTLPTLLNGKFELTDVRVYEQGTDAQGNSLGAFLAQASVSDDDLGPGVRDIKQVCSQQLGVGFSDSVKVPVILQAYFPSGRITNYDEGTAQDVAEYNYPTYANVSASTLGMDSFDMNVDKEGASPYVEGLYFSDYVSDINDVTTANILSDGSFELRMHWDKDKKDSTGKPIHAVVDAYLHFVRK